MVLKAGFLKPFVPAAVRSWARDRERQWMLWLAVRRIARLPPGRLPDARLLDGLLEAWANEGMAARPHFLEAVARYASAARGPILECGSGATTILLHLLSGVRGAPCLALENLEPWAERVRGVLGRWSGRTTVLVAPLKDYGDFSWYDVAPDAVPEGIELVVCDGPHHSTPGGRYGLLPVLGSRLASRATVLLDDAERPGEADVARRWVREGGFESRLVEGEDGRAYAVLRRGQG